LGYPFTRLLGEHLRRKLHVDVSYSTIYNTLEHLGCRYGRPKLDLEHHQDPKDVRRAKRQKEAALKKRKPAPAVVPSRIVTKQNFTSTPDYLVAGSHTVSV
jgi:hypothetical protein